MIFKLFLYVYLLWFSNRSSYIVLENICSTELHYYSMERNYLFIDIMITVCSCFNVIACSTQMCDCQIIFSVVSDAELMGVIDDVHRIVIVNRSFYWSSYTDCSYSVTSVGHACLFTTYS